MYWHMDKGRKEQFSACITQMQELGLLSRFTRALFIEIALGIEDINAVHLAQLQMEFLACGKVEVRLFQQHTRMPDIPSQVLTGYPRGRTGSCLPDVFNPEFDPTCVPQPWAPAELPLLLLLVFVFGAFLVLRVLQLWMKNGSSYVLNDYYVFDLVVFFLLVLSFSFVVSIDDNAYYRLTNLSLYSCLLKLQLLR